MSTKVTLQHIATRVGCSKAAVSVVLNGTASNISVSESMGEKIRHAARTLGYTGNYHARSLTTGRAATIGLLVGPGFKETRNSGLTGQLIDGIDTYVRSHNHDLLILGPDDGEGDLQRGAQYLRQHRIDALIVPGLSYRATRQDWPALDSRLVIAMALHPTQFPAVYLDHHSGLRQAMAHLAEWGHRTALWTPVFVDGESTTPARTAALYDVARDSHITVEELHFTYHHGEEPPSIMEQIREYRQQFALYLAHHTPPSAILAYNEVAGIGIYQALNAVGYRVPDDVSIIGFDNLWGELAVPPMTVVSLNFCEIGQQAAELALLLADGAPVTPTLTRTVATSLIVRQSTGQARG